MSYSLFIISLLFAGHFITCCLSVPLSKKTFVVYFETMGEIGNQQGSIYPITPTQGIEILGAPNSPEGFYPDFKPPLTSSGTYEPPPPPPPVSYPAAPSPPQAPPHQPIVGTGQFSFILTANSTQNFLFLTVMSPLFQLFLMYM